MFRRCSSLLPLNRVGENSAWLGFRHPFPSYPQHILLVPKKDLSNVLDLADADHRTREKFFKLLKQIIQEYHLEGNYRLITNGGSAQEVSVLHFHLVSDHHSPDISQNPGTKSA